MSQRPRSIPRPKLPSWKPSRISCTAAPLSSSPIGSRRFTVSTTSSCSSTDEWSNKAPALSLWRKAAVTPGSTPPGIILHEQRQPRAPRRRRLVERPDPAQRDLRGRLLLRERPDLSPSQKQSAACRGLGRSRLVLCRLFVCGRRERELYRRRLHPDERRPRHGRGADRDRL